MYQFYLLHFKNNDKRSCSTYTTNPFSFFFFEHCQKINKKVKFLFFVGHKPTRQVSVCQIYFRIPRSISLPPPRCNQKIVCNMFFVKKEIRTMCVYLKNFFLNRQTEKKKKITTKAYDIPCIRI